MGIARRAGATSVPTPFPKEAVYDPARMTLRDMTECGSALRRMGSGARSVEQVAERVVRYLYDELRTQETGERACVLVRLFKTHPFGALPEPLRQSVAAGPAGQTPAPGTPCLTLLATAGDEPAWNSRWASAGHKAIPLPSQEGVARIPMIAQLIKQLGLDVSTVLEPSPDLVVDLQQRTFNVFYVPDALGSPHIPAQQQFVIPHKVRSVLGFGGVLPDGDLFAVITFTRVSLPPEVAELFKPLALSVKLALLPALSAGVFEPSPVMPGAAG
jgi:two-component system NtrC family sensor kinase